jgi:hypothetical protein
MLIMLRYADRVCVWVALCYALLGMPWLCFLPAVILILVNHEQAGIV